jgi:hypothetical protein
MVNHTADNVTTWRDLADQLTPRQIALLEHPIAAPQAEADAIRLESARGFVEANGLSARIPLPAGVIQSDDWLSITRDDVAVRSLVWSNHDTEHSYISIDGCQYGDDGRFERQISVWAKHGEMALTAAEARFVAAKLIEAADELERLQ